MIFGIWLTSIGYAIFYWGIHHFSGVDCKSKNGCRISLPCALGIPDAWKIPQGNPVQLGANIQPPSTQGQTPNNAKTPSPLDTGAGSWIDKLLTGIKAPATGAAKLQAWNQCEGNVAGESGLPINNPLNITCDSYQPATCGSRTVNGAGVQAFDTIDLGIAGTIAKLNEPFASAILSNLKNGGSFGDFANAVGASHWGTNAGCISSYGKDAGGAAGV